MIFSCIYWACAWLRLPPLSWQGLSFLDLRYHLLLFYLQDLTHLISIKTEGGKIKESEALNRVVTIRTVRWVDTRSPQFYFLVQLKQDTITFFLSCLKILEKMRPLDHKLKYQIDKLVRTAVTGSLGKRFIYCNFCKLWWKKVIDLRMKNRPMENERFHTVHVLQALANNCVMCFYLFQLKMIHCSFVLTQRISSVK